MSIVARACWAQLLLMLLSSSTSVTAATVAVCEDTSGDATALYAEDGRRLQLWYGDAPAPATSCADMELPLPAAAIRWMGLVRQDGDVPVPTSLVLQGTFSTAVRVSEVQLGSEPASPPVHLALGSDVLPGFEWQPFGVEERVQLQNDGAVSCAAGTQPAGIVLRSAASWDGRLATELDLQLTGSGDIRLAIADPRREAQQSPLVLGTLVLRDELTPRVFRYRLPLQSDAWTSLILLCPEMPAEFRLRQLTLLPQDVPAPRQRSAWLWSPALWQQQAQRLFEVAQAQGLQRLFVTVPVVDKRVADPLLLQQFVTQAHARGIAVWPVVGDPRDVLAASQPALLARTQAYLDYNSTAAAEARLDGLQLDIEPHLLPGFALAQPHWRQRYLETVQAVQGVLAGRLELDLVLPVWWGEHEHWGSALLQALQGSDLSLTIMNYRTDVDALRAGAQPFLAWGQDRDIPVSIALEAGSIGPDEERRHYLSAVDAGGELLWLQLGEWQLLVLLDVPRSGLPGAAYALQRSSLARSTAITFAGDLANLAAIAASLEPQWRSWASYAGLALHGLDELLLQGAD